MILVLQIFLRLVFATDLVCIDILPAIYIIILFYVILFHLFYIFIPFLIINWYFFLSSLIRKYIWYTFYIHFFIWLHSYFCCYFIDLIVCFISCSSHSVDTIVFLFFTLYFLHSFILCLVISSTHFISSNITLTSLLPSIIFLQL